MKIVKEEQFEIIKKWFDNCESQKERRSVFFTFFQDDDYDGNTILLVMKELKINDKFEMEE